MKRIWRVGLIMALIATVLAAGCAKASESASVEAPQKESWAQPAGQADYVEEAVMVESEREADMGVGSASMTSSNVPDRMIVRTVQMSVVVEDTDVMLSQVQALVATHGGYVAASNRWLSGEQAYASVTVRIPADKLDLALGVLRDASISVENESSSGDDVTEEYVDISARLKNLEAAEEELLALLTEVRKNRGSAEDVLAIYNRMIELRAQIESLKGRQQYLEKSAALATVHLEIRPKQQPGTIVQPAKWNPLVTASNALRAFVELLQILLDVLIWLLVLSPVILIPALVIWLIVRAIKRRRAGQSAS